MHTNGETWKETEVPYFWAYSSLPFLKKTNSYCFDSELYPVHTNYKCQTLSIYNKGFTRNIEIEITNTTEIFREWYTILWKLKYSLRKDFTPVWEAN